MAKTRVTRRKTQAAPVLSRLQGNLKKLQRDAEAMLSRARKEAVRVSRDQKQAVDRIGSEARRLRSDLQKLVKQTSTDLESRSKGFLATIEKEAEKRLKPVVRRLVGDLPLRQEMHQLARRVQELEQRLKQHEHPEPTASAPAAPPDFGPTPTQES
jgi:polyhydroxyalkanoate synthesis regulator phasin